MTYPDTYALAAAATAAYSQPLHSHRPPSSTYLPPALYLCDLSTVARQVHTFRTLLPGITPYYAVKCNSDAVLLSFLARLHVSFDVASSHEISLISTLVPAPLSARTIFANPFKAPSELSYARSHGIDLVTVDAVDEVHKVALHHPLARVLLRIAVDDSDSACPLSSKFGALASEVAAILAAVRGSDATLVGVAFHVGSGCRDAAAYTRALGAARRVFDAARDAGLPRLSVLDIGGGFPGRDGANGAAAFADIASGVRQGVQELFDADTQVIAEPGRYFVATAYTLAVQVVQTGRRDGARWCVVADGVHGSFRDAWLLDQEFQASAAGDVQGDLAEWEVRGASRAAGDAIANRCMLPCGLAQGDWVRFADMGAYTMCLATRVGGAGRHQVAYYYSGRGSAAADDGG
ncbi:Ornithine decarboxylase [Chondrus crispus]|uniref:Ornithine decarboxylase n=1 Tax=Chondrus crispus TaxID=2769 RepID=R7QJI6_CHOCR|nr:Ornithine decarboxylase [Chondrus crispus]CDF37626.1 Ornithine decarboxylase [Chondrus crispus]|eukprot:XP_005717497.1 Ornithine decarboxylase [Chondrus crispus]